MEAGNGNRGQLGIGAAVVRQLLADGLAGDRHEPFAAALLTAELSPSDGRRQPRSALLAALEQIEPLRPSFAAGSMAAATG